MNAKLECSLIYNCKRTRLVETTIYFVSLGQDYN